MGGVTRLVVYFVNKVYFFYGLLLSSFLVHAKDLVPVPKKPEKESTRRPPKKVPSWHLTSDASMQYIKNSDERKSEEKKKQEKYDKAKKEAVARVKQEERKAQKPSKVVTRLFKPAPQPKRRKRVR